MDARSSTTARWLLTCGLLFATELVGQVADGLVETRALAKAKRDPHAVQSAIGGGIVAYTRFDESKGATGLYARQGDGVEVDLLKDRFHFGEVISGVSVSRDGKRIAFSAGGFTWHYPSRVYSIDLDGTHLTLLASSREECPGFQSSEFGSPYCSHPSNPKISPDGASIAYREMSRTSLPANQRGDPPEQDVHQRLLLVPVEGGASAFLGEMSKRVPEMAWNPDGESLLYLEDQEGSIDLVRVDTRTRIRRRLCSLPPRGAQPYSLTVAPEGHQVYVVGDQGLYEIDLETSAAELLKGGTVSAFRLSPQGMAIVLVDNLGIGVIERETGEFRRLAPDSDTHDDLGLRGFLMRRSQKLSRGFRRPSDDGPSFDLIEWVSQNEILVVAAEGDQARYGTLVLR